MYIFLVELDISNVEFHLNFQKNLSGIFMHKTRHYEYRILLVTRFC